MAVVGGSLRLWASGANGVQLVGFDGVMIAECVQIGIVVGGLHGATVTVMRVRGGIWQKQ